MAWRRGLYLSALYLYAAWNNEPRESHSKLKSFQATLEAWVLASYAAVSRSFPLGALFSLESLNGSLCGG